MRQFDVLRNTNPGTRDAYPYLLILQSDLLSDLSSKVAAPLVPASALPGATILNPVLPLPNGNFILLIQQIAGLPEKGLKAPAIANLSEHRDTILRALDRLFLGY